MPTVRELMEAYEDGQIEFEELKAELAAHEYTVANVRSIAEAIERGLEDPDDNDFEWVEMAGLEGVLTLDQVEEIAHAILDYHHRQGPK
jgi:hypothetical protein